MSTPNGYQWNQGNQQQPQYPHYQTPYENGPQPTPAGGPWPSNGATDAVPWYKRWYFLGGRRARRHTRRCADMAHRERQ